MKNKEINKKDVMNSVNKMIADKNSVRSYIKGKISIQSLSKKGIKFAKPI